MKIKRALLCSVGRRSDSSCSGGIGQDSHIHKRVRLSMWRIGTHSRRVVPRASTCACLCKLSVELFIFRKNEFMRILVRLG